MNRLKLAIFGLCFAAALTSHAQPGLGLGHYQFVPQRVMANPAYRPLAKVNVGFPALSSLHFDHHNNWLRPDVAFGETTNGRSLFDAETFLNHIGDEAVTSQALSLNLFHLGLGFGDHYVHLSVTERIGMRLALPADLFYLAAYGNAGSHAFDQHTADFSGLSLNAIHYREYALGYSLKLGDAWSVGATVKYLYGMENVDTKTSTLKLRTDPNTYALSTSGAMVVRTAGLNTEETNEDETWKTYGFGRKNKGAAIDVGAVFRPFEKLSVSLSIHDLGWIRWQHDVANYGTEDASFLHDGFDVGDYLFAEDGSFSDSLDAQAEAFVNDLEDQYNVDKTTDPYTDALHGYVRYGARYDLWQHKKLGGSATLDVVHGLGDGMVPFRATLGYQQQVGRVLELGVHLGKRSGAKPGLGGGLALNAGFFQLYAMADNIRAARLIEVNHVTDDGASDTYTLPKNSDDIRFTLGINLTFGRKSEPESHRSFID